MVPVLLWPAPVALPLSLVSLPRGVGGQTRLIPEAALGAGSRWFISVLGTAVRHGHWRTVLGGGTCFTGSSVSSYTAEGVFRSLLTLAHAFTFHAEQVSVSLGSTSVSGPRVGDCRVSQGPGWDTARGQWNVHFKILLQINVLVFYSFSLCE